MGETGVKPDSVTRRPMLRAPLITFSTATVCPRCVTKTYIYDGREKKQTWRDGDLGSNLVSATSLGTWGAGRASCTIHLAHTTGDDNIPLFIRVWDHPSHHETLSTIRVSEPACLHGEERGRNTRPDDSRPKQVFHLLWPRCLVSSGFMCKYAFLWLLLCAVYHYTTRPPQIPKARSGL